MSIWTYNTPPVSRPISDYPAHIAIVPHISVVLSRGFVLCHALTGFRRAPLCRFIALSVPSCIFAEGLPSQFFCNGMDYPCGYSPASDSAGRGWQCRAGRLFLRLEAALIRRETYKNRPARWRRLLIQVHLCNISSLDYCHVLRIFCALYGKFFTKIVAILSNSIYFVSEDISMFRTSLLRSALFPTRGKCW